MIPNDYFIHKKYKRTLIKAESEGISIVARFT